MHARKTAWSLAAIVGVTCSLLMGPAPAAEPAAEALNVEQAQVPNALTPLKSATHLEFLRRPINGAPHTFALLGSRDLTDTSGGWVQPGAGLNIFDLTDPANPSSDVPAPRFIQNVPCVTDNLDSAAVTVDVTVPMLDADGAVVTRDYDQIVAVSSNDIPGCALVKHPNGTDVKYADGKAAKGAAVAFIGIRKTPADGAVLSADWLGSPVKTTTGARYTWTKMAHTVVPHPTRPIVYVASQNIPDRPNTVEILDLSAWPPVARSAPLAGTGAAPHDITFSPDGNRAYVSSINASFIWDTSGAKVFAPTLITTLVAPGLKLHHEANLHPNKRHLLVVDEFVATSSNGQVTATPNCPGGGVHVFDLGPDAVLEAAPVQVGAFFSADTSITGREHLESLPDSDDPAETVEDSLEIGCTAHEFTMAPNGRWMPIGWMGSGVRVFDLTSLGAAAGLPAPSPVAVSEFGHYKAPGTNVWAAKVLPEFPTYIFASDSKRGFEVLHVTSTP